MTVSRIIFILTISIYITSCSLMSPVKMRPVTQYILSVSNHEMVKNKKSKRRILLINTPEVRPALNTTRMAYSLYPYQINYYAVNEWAETPGQLLLAVLQQGLKRSHAFKAVVIPNFTAHYDYVLTTEIYKFTQNFQHRTPYFELGLNAELLDVNTNRLLKTQTFIFKVPMKSKSPYAGVFAANQAASDAINALINFCQTTHKINK